MATAAGLLTAGFTSPAPVAEPAPAPSAANYAARARQTFAAAKRRYEASAEPQAAWEFGRACFDWAEYATNEAQRAAIAQAGIAACRPLVQREPTLAAAPYYLAMNLGQLARTKTLGALKLVDEMERLFKTAHDLDPRFDHAGPDRNLGLLYRDAPGWPASIGSRRKARLHLQRAVQLAGDFPENRLTLLESYVLWGDRDGAASERRATARLFPLARTNLTGLAWAPSWEDWEKRWRLLGGQPGAAQAP